MKNRNSLKFFTLFLAFVFVASLIPHVNAIDVIGSIDADVTVEQLTADSQILKYVDASVFASNNHVRRLEEDETLSSYVFLNRDGTKTIYYTYEEVKYQAADGTMHEKDISLVSTTNGYTTVSNDVELELPNDPGNGIGISYLGYDITLTPQGGMLRAPAQNNGTSVCYPNYFGVGTLLMYTPTLSGIKEDIVLAHYTGINTFSFRLETDGLNLYLENDRYYLAESEEAEMRIDMGDIVSFDAHGKFSIGTLAVETITPGDEYILTLTVDEAFLTDENTTYPVSIDPTLTVSDNTHGAGAIEDVTIYSGRPNVNGNWTYSHCGYYDNTYQVARTLFRLSGLTSDALYLAVADSSITSVKIHIREATGTPAIPVYLYANTGSSAWSETGATWNNAGLSIGNLYGIASPASNSDTVYDITNLVKAWKSGALSEDSGFVLVSSNETSADKAFYASEFATSSYRPYVVVTYDSPVSIDRTYSTYTQTAAYRTELLNRMNCYGYALHIYSLQIVGGEYKQQPGEFARDDIPYSTNYALLQSAMNGPNATAQGMMDFLEAAVYADFASLSGNGSEWTITRTTANAAVPSGYRKIALSIGLGYDYHFYMRHSDGMWSHKPGTQAVTNLSLDSKVVITDSNISSVVSEGGYDDGVRYYLIQKSAVIDYPHNNGHADSTEFTLLHFSDYAGDTVEKSRMVTGSHCIARIDYSTDVDFFAFQPAVTATYRITTSSSTAGDLDLLMLDMCGNLLASDGSTGNPDVSLTLIGGKTYYFRVTDFQKNVSEYTIYFEQQ